MQSYFNPPPVAIASPLNPHQPTTFILQTLLSSHRSQDSYVLYARKLLEYVLLYFSPDFYIVRTLLDHYSKFQVSQNVCSFQQKISHLLLLALVLAAAADPRILELSDFKASRGWRKVGSVRKKYRRSSPAIQLAASAVSQNKHLTFASFTYRRPSYLLQIPRNAAKLVTLSSAC